MVGIAKRKAAVSGGEVSVKKKGEWRKTLKKNWEFLLMVLPGALHTIIFAYIPMVGILVAFKSINFAQGIIKSPWVGFENFKFLFKNPDAWVILRNTLGYNLVFLILGAIIPVAIAILLSQLRNKVASKCYQTVMILPHFISWVVVSYVVYAFFSYRYGILNKTILPMLGMESIDWYAQPGLWSVFLVFIREWKGFGYSSVVYLASIAGIDATLYEAAAIDGANKRQQMWYITIPELMNIIVIMLILNIGKILNADFGLFYNVPMDRGELYPVTNVISTFVYRALKINNDIGMSSAAGFLQSVVGFILVVTTNKIVKRIDSSKGLF